MLGLRARLQVTVHRALSLAEATLNHICSSWSTAHFIHMHPGMSGLHRLGPPSGVRMVRTAGFGWFHTRVRGLPQSERAIADTDGRCSHGVTARLSGWQGLGRRLHSQLDKDRLIRRERPSV